MGRQVGLILAAVTAILVLVVWNPFAGAPSPSRLHGAWVLDEEALCGYVDHICAMQPDSADGWRNSLTSVLKSQGEFRLEVEAESFTLTNGPQRITGPSAITTEEPNVLVLKPNTTERLVFSIGLIGADEDTFPGQVVLHSLPFPLPLRRPSTP